MATQETKVEDVHDTMKTVIVENNATLTSQVSLDPPDMVHLVFGEIFYELCRLILNLWSFKFKRNNCGILLIQN